LGAVIVRRSKGTEGFSDAEEAQLDYMTAVASANLVRAFERKALELERGRLKGKVQGFQEGVKDTCKLANPEPDDTTIADDFLSICKTKVTKTKYISRNPSRRITRNPPSSSAVNIQASPTVNIQA
jgi:hypothetical protein